MEECRQEIDNTKFEIAQVTKEREDLSYQLLIQKAPYSNKNTIEELSKSADSYRKELTKLRSDVFLFSSFFSIIIFLFIFIIIFVIKVVKLF